MNEVDKINKKILKTSDPVPCKGREIVTISFALRPSKSGYCLASCQIHDVE